MKIKLLKDIASSIAGSNASGVVDLLYDKKNVNEFLIAKKLKLTINQTRNILYKLGDQGLVSFIRKKDTKKGGWYTYFWTINQGKSLEKFKEVLSTGIANLNTQLGNLRNIRFFYSPACNLELTEENALLHDYHCTECGDLLQLKDNSSGIASIKNEIGKKEEILKEINEELQIIGVADEKTKIRRMKSEAKKKTKERLIRKKERARLAKKEERNAKKKKPKKVKKKVKAKDFFKKANKKRKKKR